LQKLIKKKFIGNFLHHDFQKKSFLIGLSVHLLFVAILFIGDTTFSNLQIPEGQYEHNIWAKCSDVMSYVRPAKNFEEYGVVGYHYTPDHFRTVGYPVFIGTLMKIASNNWLYILIIIQAVLFALCYPLVIGIYKLLFPNLRGERLLFYITLLSGVYWVRVAQVLTDTLFSMMLLAGIYYGLRFYKERIVRIGIFYVLVVTIAAVIRPTLSMFFLINLSLAWIVASRSDFVKKAGTLKVSLSLSLIFLLSCNLATFRNIKNYSLYSPSSVVSLNMFEYLGKRVLIANGQLSQYTQIRDSISQLGNINQITQARKSVTYSIVAKYPVATVKEVLIKNSANLLLSNHYENIANYYGYSWKKGVDECFPYKASKWLLILSYFLMLVYFLIFVGFLFSLYNLLITRQFAMLAFVGLMFGLFVIPGMITGSGGARFRLPFEGLMLILVVRQLLRYFSYNIQQRL
jgi:hypothetical protein